MRRRYLSEERLEEIRQWTNSLSKLSREEDCSIIIEGRRDRESLEMLGVTGKFESLWELTKKIKSGEENMKSHGYVILTDFDRKGRELHDRLMSELSSLGARVIEWPRSRYRGIGLPHRVEEAYSWVRSRTKWG